MNNVFAKELEKIRKSQKVLAIFGLLFVCVIFWGIISLFSAQKKSKIDKQLIDLAKPLNPTIDATIFPKIQLKRSFSASELANFPIYQIIANKKTREKVVVPLGVTDDELNQSTKPKPTPPVATNSGVISN